MSASLLVCRTAGARIDRPHCRRSHATCSVRTRPSGEGSADQKHGRSTHSLGPARSSAPEQNLHVVGLSIIDQGDGSVIDRGTVERRRRYAATAARRIRHDDLVAAVPEAPGNAVLRPTARDARIDDERRAATAKAEDALEAGAV